MGLPRTWLLCWVCSGGQVSGRQAGRQGQRQREQEVAGVGEHGKGRRRVGTGLVMCCNCRVRSLLGIHKNVMAPHGSRYDLFWLSSTTCLAAYRFPWTAIVMAVEATASGTRVSEDTAVVACRHGLWAADGGRRTGPWACACAGPGARRERFHM